MAARGRCAAGHEVAAGRGRGCPRCRRDQVVLMAAAAEGSLPLPVVAAAVGAVATSPAVLRELAAALAAGPGVFRLGAPPVAGRLVAELTARGSVTLTAPACSRCGRAGMPLTRTDAGAMCKPCAARRFTAACAHCGEVKPVASRDSAGRRICERCRRHDRGHRQCGICGKTASIAVRARDGAPDICVNCYRMPGAVCSVCGKERECNFAGTSRPVCPSCSPRVTASCARCGQDRPVEARWAEGPVCDPCYRAALRHRGQCASCGQQRRLVTPPGPAADTCSDCAGLPAICVCADCGIEDKLYERGRCDRCSLRRRAAELLTDTRPRTYTASARRNIRAAAGFLTWLRGQDRTLSTCRQGDVDAWLATTPGACQVRDFLTWAARHGHCPPLHAPGPARRDGTAISQDHRWTLAARLLHDDSIDLTDRAAGCLLLLYGQQLSRIAAMTTSQITSRDGTVFTRFGDHDLPVPGPLGTILTELIRTGRSHTGTGSPASTPWLFPGGLPGRPITPARLGERLRTLGIYAMTGRRAALLDLAAQLPAAVLADLLHIAPTTAVRWMRQAGGDWSRYAAELTRTGSSPTLRKTPRAQAPGSPIQHDW